MILESDSSVLDSHEMYFPSLLEKIIEIRREHGEKQWHQLTMLLMVYVEEEELQSE